MVRRGHHHGAPGALGRNIIAAAALLACLGASLLAVSRRIDALAGGPSARATLCLLAASEAALLTVYFVWMFAGLRREARRREDELGRAQYMLDVGQLLFDAPNRPEHIGEALARAADALGSRRAFLFARRGGGGLLYSWERGGGMRQMQLDPEGEFPRLTALFRARESIVCREPGELLPDCPQECAALRGRGIGSLMLVPLRGLDGAPVGALGAVDFDRRHVDAGLLESVALSFSLALGAIESFRTIREMGLVDQLTGLLNRNCYQRALEEFERGSDETLACVYIDADGLHEINNHWGHVSGDRMLQTVARALCGQFGKQNAYRIGGDEFIVFCTALGDREIAGRVEAMERAVAAQGYHISAGMERRRDSPLVCQMVKRAEERMYEAKRRYYQNRGDEEQAREMNRQLEQTLTEKRDLDVFRAVLASKYLGVYIVDLSVDAMRSIYIPPYFERAVERAGGKFSAAMRIYAAETVEPPCRECLLRFLDYGEIERRLRDGEQPSLLYRRTDGMRLRLRVYRSPDYSPERREIIWTFEVAGED